MKTKVRQPSRIRVWVACDLDENNRRAHLCTARPPYGLDVRLEDHPITAPWPDPCCPYPLTKAVMQVDTRWIRATLVFNPRVALPMDVPAPLTVVGGRAIDNDD